MGRKKKKTTKPWCWYCNREFEDEKILLQHQKAKHFKCHICHKKLYTGPGLQIHCMQVHKENIERVPNSVKGRDNISLEICGMDNIPEEDLIEHEKQKALYSGRSVTGNDDEGNSDSDNDSDHSTNTQKQTSATAAKSQQPPLPNTPFGKQLPPGTIHGPLPHMPPLPPMPAQPGATIGSQGVLPPNPLMMNPLMNSMHHPHPMMYHNPHMAAAMMSHPMIHPMMFQPPPLPPPPSSSSINPNTNHNSNQPPLPPPLMSQPIPKPLMGFNATPTGSVAASSSSSSSSQPLPPPQPHLASTQHAIKSLFPINDEINVNNNTNRLTPPNNLPNKIESLAPGSKIVHPEDDISLEEYRASHHKYKYIPPQYSAPAVPNPLARAHSQQNYSGYQQQQQQQHSSYHNGSY